MVEHNPPPPAEGAHLPVIPLPTALYVSDGLVFGLYDGGSPAAVFRTRWERLVLAMENREAASEGPQTVSRVHQE